jgi:hypothetical protein
MPAQAKTEPEEVAHEKRMRPGPGGTGRQARRRCDRASTDQG